MRWFLFVFGLGCYSLLNSGTAYGDNPAPSSGPASAPAGEWVNISNTLAAVVGKVEEPAVRGATSLMTGLTALNLDPATGDVYIGFGRKGIWKSTDHGNTWALSDGGQYTAMASNSYSCDADPEGGRLVFWGSYGRSMITLDGGKTWASAGDRFHDWGATDWSDPAAKTMWVCPHGGNVISVDGGKTWNKSVPDKITGFGLFDAKTFVGRVVDAIFVSTDGGSEFVKKTVKVAPTDGACMKVYKGVGYWVSPQGLLVSKDKGQTWEIHGAPLQDPIAGPYFGEGPDHMVVVTKASFLETTDGGDTWTPIAPSLADAHWNTDKNGDTIWCRYFAWDAKNNILYGAKNKDSAMRWVLPVRPAVKSVAPRQVKAVEAPAGWRETPRDVNALTAPTTLWDGDSVLPREGNYCDPKAKNIASATAETDVVHWGKVAMELRLLASQPAENGKAVASGSWNWRGWSGGRTGDNLANFTHLVFWMKVEKGKAIENLTVGLTSAGAKAASAQVDVTQYCKEALDGEWHRVAIPASDLSAADSSFDPKAACGLTVACRTAPTEVPFSVYFDDLVLDSYRADFDHGIGKFSGVAVTEGLPAGSKGAVGAEQKDGKIQNIRSNMDWSPGLFTALDGQYLNFRAKVTKAEVVGVFLVQRAPDGSGGSVHFEAKVPASAFQANEWKVVSVPLKDFHGSRDGAATAVQWEQPVWQYFFDLLGRDLGLVIDRVWVTKGPPKDGEVPPASK